MPRQVVASTLLARVNGVEVAYQVHGSGKPLVLLHGGFGSIEMFGPNVAALAAGRQVIGVDLQSHGRTPAVDRPMRFETMADDIAALIRYLGHEQPTSWASRWVAAWRCGRRSSIRRSFAGSSSSRRHSSGPDGIASMSTPSTRWVRRSPSR